MSCDVAGVIKPVRGPTTRATSQFPLRTDSRQLITQETYEPSPVSGPRSCGQPQRAVRPGVLAVRVRTPTPWILPTQPVTRALLAAAGITDDMIATHVRAGRLRRLRRGVYMASENWPDDPAGQHLVLAHAVQVANPDAILSHQSAAVALGLPTPGFAAWHDALPSLTQPADSRRRSRERNAELSVRTIGPTDIVRDRDGYRATSVARTAVDLAAGLALPEALVLLDDAARRLVTAMVSSARRADYSNPRYAAAARDLLTAAMVRPLKPLVDAIAKADPARESPAESLTAGHLYRSGLPMPLFQAPLRTRIGTVFLDFLWPEHRLVGECDGAMKYTDRRALVEEKIREDAVRETGHRFVRWMGADPMVRPDELISRIARALGL